MELHPTKEHIQNELAGMIREITRDPNLQVDPNKSLMDDYGLDSLDLLDFTFNIEETFGVKIGSDELRGRAKTKWKDSEALDEKGFIRHEVLDELRRNIPEIPPDKWKYGLRKESIPRLLNTNVFVRIVSEKLMGTES